jgi:hypothetical protein
MMIMGSVFQHALMRSVRQEPGSSMECLRVVPNLIIHRLGALQRKHWMMKEITTLRDPPESGKIITTAFHAKVKGTTFRTMGNKNGDCATQRRKVARLTTFSSYLKDAGKKMNR